MKMRKGRVPLGKETKVGGKIRAGKLLSMCQAKLRTMDDEEELFRSVLITNTIRTIRTVRQEINTGGKKGKKKIPEKIVKRLQKRINLLGSRKNRGMWPMFRYKMRRIIGRNTGTRLAQTRFK